MNYHRHVKTLGVATLEKEAARWREAIRSGEITPGPEAEALKVRMGVDPAREAAGLERGAINLAKSKGFDVYDYTEDQIQHYKNLWRSGNFKERLEALKHLVRINAAKFTGGALTLPDVRGIQIAPGKVLKHFPGPQIIINRPAVVDTFGRLGGGVPSDTNSLLANVISHEGNEARFARRLTDEARRTGNVYDVSKYYKVPNPVLVNAPPNPKPLNAVAKFIKRQYQKLLNKNKTFKMLVDAGMSTGSHMNPEVILKEIRDARMLPPDVQGNFNVVRGVTGEAEHLRKAVGTAPSTKSLADIFLGRLRGKQDLNTNIIPKKQMRSIAGKMHAMAAGEFPIARETALTEGSRVLGALAERKYPRLLKLFGRLL